MDFLRLLQWCVSIFLKGRHSIEPGHIVLLNYLDNIENIGGPERAAPYRVCLATLDE